MSVQTRVRYKVLILCQHTKHENPPIIRDNEDAAIQIARVWLAQHKPSGCKAAVVKETTYTTDKGSRSEYEHIATFYYAELPHGFAEDVVWSDRE